jgi:hypothetical protein
MFSSAPFHTAVRAARVRLCSRTSSGAASRTPGAAYQLRWVAKLRFATASFERKLAWAAAFFADAAGKPWYKPFCAVGGATHRVNEFSVFRGGPGAARLSAGHTLFLETGNWKLKTGN